MEVYKNVGSFIRFSGINPEHVDPDEKEIIALLNAKMPIDFEYKDKKAFIRIYSSDTKKSDIKQITSFAREIEHEYDTIVLVKKNWTSFEVKKVVIRSYADFICDVAAINIKFYPKVIKNDSSLEFHKIDKDNLAKINSNDPLAKWLLAEVDDIISYIITTENGPYLSKRVVVGESYY